LVFEPSFAIGEGALWLSADKGVERRDPVDGSLVARIEDPFPISRVVAGEGAVWALDDAGLVRIDPAGNKIVSRNRRFAFLQGFGFVAGGMAAGAGAIWISDAQGDVVFQLDPASSRVTRTIRVGDDPLGITVHAGFVWVANHNDGTVSRIDAKRGKVVATIKVGPNPSEIAAGEGGVWVTVSPT
jgi:YVTN family beta-propeller protein